SYGYAPSSQDKNHSEICDPSINKYWETGSKSHRFNLSRHFHFGASESADSDAPKCFYVCFRQQASGHFSIVLKNLIYR
ncbi:MAG: hypothetical protein K2I26_03455, partial [Paramuribaculum sp.]|nr:hypothetical protein [Paramuribaculum sp.]